ncbi:MAG TPA: sigma-54-dependent Fis family transcriptional regulator [Desulfobacteraceae bacterium]|nr:sigma-54-dependent Fis family transcriptional regulator [Desulfobacteraceae bacterium]
MKSIEETSLLYEISESLNQHMDMKKSLFKVLTVLSESLNLIRGIIFLTNSETGEIRIEMAHGISEEKTREIIYLPGEGIIGKVIQTGKPAVVPRISEEPLFLDKTHSRNLTQGQEYSFICVPIKKDNRVVGAISADRPYEGKRSLANGEKLLSVVATMVAHHVINIETIRVEKELLKTENLRLKSELENKYSFTNIIGNSNKMREVLQMISQVSSSSATVLIRGESGTGKELVANSIHYNSARNQKPFIKINCAAIPENLIESELFGHEKGAFTGAHRQRIGRFEIADQGTIFLDEIGDMSADLQVKLLRALQERRFERVGGSQTIDVDIRVISATNKDLPAAIEKGTFREDLYYRLNVIPIHILPLRERTEDILPLISHFQDNLAKRMPGFVHKTFSDDALQSLLGYEWPGNIRELENLVERISVLVEEDTVGVHDLPQCMAGVLGNQDASSVAAVFRNEIGFSEAVDAYQKALISHAMNEAGGVKAKAAEILKMNRTTLVEKIKKMDIQSEPDMPIF